MAKKNKISGSAIARTWFLTLWDGALKNMGIEIDWENMEATQAAIETAFNDISPNYYVTICDKPQGKKHGYHIHAAVTYDKPKRLNAVAKDFGKAHVEVMRGTKEEAVAYMNKEGKFEEKGEEVLVKFGKESAIENNSGQRLDIRAIECDIRQDKITASNLHAEALARAKTSAQVEEIKRIYRQVKLATAPTRDRPLKVIYVEGEPGSGKTHGAYERYKDIFRVSVDANNNFPFNGYIGQKVLLLDELRPGIFNAPYLFEILDKKPLTVNVKGGDFPALWETVIITTAFKLDDWFNKPDEYVGQDSARKQFRRRIHEHYKCIVTEEDEDGNTLKSEWRLIDDKPKKTPKPEFIPLFKSEEKLPLPWQEHFNP